MAIPDVVGLNQDLIKIADRLTGGPSHLQVIPIVGMGGIGKTTLAKNVYHHPLTTDAFMVRAWVTVSQDYKPQSIYTALLACFKQVENESSGQEKVHKFLKGRKYLIVLDDLWSHGAWDDASICLPDDGNGSRVVITTRLVDVATYAGSSSDVHRMRFMGWDESWDLLKKKVFPSSDCPSYLVHIGMKISRRCGGLPLAVVLVAGMLSTVLKTGFSWKEVEKKVDSARELDEIISLSYTNLPHHLRPCFQYMVAFPEDHEIRASKLVKLWIAEGFVELEEEAIECLEDLVKKSLALVTRRKSDGKIKSCSVHDLVRMVCRRRGEEENIQHRLSIAHPDLVLVARNHGSTLRSVVCFRPSESSLGALPGFKLLRVLDVVDDNEHPLPAQVFDLFHLRYLAFACPSEIPAATSRLENLRTLIVCPRFRSRRRSRDVLSLPSEIWMMPQLTHLVSFYNFLPVPRVVDSPLETLLTLSVAGRFLCTEKMTQMLPNVKKLRITYFGGKIQKDNQLRNLVFLHQLEKLKLVLEGDYVIPFKVRPVFPETLRKLTLSGWRFPWKYMDNVGCRPNLQVLKLRNLACKGDTWKTKEDQFPSLEFLEIAKSNLKKWVTEGSHFPRLKRLILFDCSRLSKIPNDIGDMPTLELIQVNDANESLVKCVRRIQEEHRDYGNYDPQVHSANGPNWKAQMRALEMAWTLSNISSAVCTIM